jgi:hypothetical protein
VLSFIIIITNNINITIMLYVNIYYYIRNDWINLGFVFVLRLGLGLRGYYCFKIYLRINMYGYIWILNMNVNVNK